MEASRVTSIHRSCGPAWRVAASAADRRRHRHPRGRRCHADRFVPRLLFDIRLRRQRVVQRVERRQRLRHLWNRDRGRRVRGRHGRPSCARRVREPVGVRKPLVERGPFPGSKNVYGGVVYGRVLDDIIPAWWSEVPVERWVVRRSTMMMTEDQSLAIDYAQNEPTFNAVINSFR